MMIRLTLLGIVLAAPIPAVAQTPAPQAPMRPSLSLEAARSGIDVCLAMAAERGWRVAVAVRDRGGALVAFERMDDVFVRQIDLALVKAETAATTPLSTRALADRAAAEGSGLAAVGFVSGVTLIEGGEPIIGPGRYAIGGVGVSGATPAQDGECARAAADAMVRR